MTSIAPTRHPEAAIPTTTATKRHNTTKHRSESVITPAPTANTSTSKRASKGGLEQYVKLSIRLLPPGLKEDEFLNQMANIYPHHASKIHLHYFVQGSYPLTPFELPIYSRAYVSFRNVPDSSEFYSFVKNKPFQDEKDSIIPIVEKSVFQKMTTSENFSILKRESQVDKNSSRLEDDEIYKKFLLYLDKGLDDFDLKRIHKSLNKRHKEKISKDQSVPLSKGSQHKKDTKSKNSAKGKEKDRQKKPKAKTKQNAKKKEKEKEKEKEDGQDADKGLEKGKGKENENKKRKKKRKRRAQEQGTTGEATAGKDASKDEKVPTTAKAPENKKDVSGGSKSRLRQRNRKKGGERKESGITKHEDEPASSLKELKPIKILSKKSKQETSEANVKN